jgi:hypothetical protein
MRGWVCCLQLLLGSYSRNLFPWDSWSYFTFSDSSLLQPGGPGSRIYIAQEQGGTVITLGTGFPFRRLLPLTGLPYKYQNPPPHGVSYWLAAGPRYIASARTAQKTPLPTLTLLLRVTQPLPRNYCFSDSTVLVLSKYATLRFSLEWPTGLYAEKCRKI